jgi:ankyrin repeat protein
MSRPCLRLLITGILMLPMLVISALALDSASALADAAERRDRPSVDRLLNSRVDLDGRQGDGATALHWAAHWDDLATVDRLIKSGAALDAANDYGVTPLWLARPDGTLALP